MKTILKVLADLIAAMLLTGIIMIAISFIPYLSKANRAQSYYVQGIYNCVLQEDPLPVLGADYERGLKYLNKAVSLKQDNKYYQYALVFFTLNKNPNSTIKDTNLSSEAKLYSILIKCNKKIGKITNLKQPQEIKDLQVLSLLNSIGSIDTKNGYIDYLKASVYANQKNQVKALALIEEGNKKPELRLLALPLDKKLRSTSAELFLSPLGKWNSNYSYGNAWKYLNLQAKKFESDKKIIEAIRIREALAISGLKYINNKLYGNSSVLMRMSILNGELNSLESLYKKANLTNKVENSRQIIKVLKDFKDKDELLENSLSLPRLIWAFPIVYFYIIIIAGKLWLSLILLVCMILYSKDRKKAIKLGFVEYKVLKKYKFEFYKWTVLLGFYIIYNFIMIGCYNYYIKTLSLNWIYFSLILAMVFYASIPLAAYFLYSKYINSKLFRFFESRNDTYIYSDGEESKLKRNKLGFASQIASGLFLVHVSAYVFTTLFSLQTGILNFPYNIAAVYRMPNEYHLQKSADEAIAQIKDLPKPWVLENKK